MLRVEMALSVSLLNTGCYNEIMKKLFVFIFFVLFSILPVFADSKEFGFRGPLNYFQSKVLEKIISTEVKKVVGGNITTDIRSYGAKALRNGIFKFA